MRPSSPNRRWAREVALQVLYGMDAQADVGPEQALRDHEACLRADTPDIAPPEGLSEAEVEDLSAFAAQLVRGVHAERAAIDEVITRSSRNWRLERMNMVDRNLLRLSTYELQRCPDVPARVALNEAIELAKRYGTGESAAFINGVLDRVLAVLGRHPERLGATSSPNRAQRQPCS